MPDKAWNTNARSPFHNCETYSTVTNLLLKKAIYTVFTIKWSHLQNGGNQAEQNWDLKKKKNIQRDKLIIRYSSQRFQFRTCIMSPLYSYQISFNFGMYHLGISSFLAIKFPSVNSESHEEANWFKVHTQCVQYSFSALLHRWYFNKAVHSSNWYRMMTKPLSAQNIWI